MLQIIALILFASHAAAPPVMTLAELAPRTGADGGAILVGACGLVFDVTNGGRAHYGPGAPYSIFAGRDASRALATGVRRGVRARAGAGG
jgi:hypothetical protein